MKNQQAAASEKPAYLEMSDVARALGISSSGVRALIHRGELTADATTERGVGLFTRKQVEELAKKRKGA